MEKLYKVTDDLAKSTGANHAARVDGCDYEKFKKSPPFNGDPNPTVARAWIKRLQKIIKIFRCSDQQKVAYAILCWRGEHKTGRRQSVHWA